MFGTGRKSILKSISSKPLKVTGRDALIVTVLTIVITLVCTWLYYMAIDAPEGSRDYITVALQTAGTTLVLQYIYEYTGVNNMIAESSIRYAQGTSLAKYASRREALIYRCLYKLLASDKYKQHEETIKNNFRKLKIILINPKLSGDIMDLHEGSRTMEELHRKYPNNIEDIATLLTLPGTVIPAVNTISDRISEEIVYDILVNGFDGYVLKDTLIFSEIQTTSRGAEIVKELE